MSFLPDALIHKSFQGVVDHKGHVVVEIGPGPGGLTRSLLGIGAQVVVVEKDTRFTPILEALQQAAGPQKLHLVWEDAIPLCMDEEAQGGHRLLQVVPQSWRASATRLSVVGNLPFAVATPLLLGLLRQIAEGQGVFAGPHQVSLALIFQQEVAEVWWWIPPFNSPSSLYLVPWVSFWTGWESSCVCVFLYLSLYVTLSKLQKSQCGSPPSLFFLFLFCLVKQRVSFRSYT